MTRRMKGIISLVLVAVFALGAIGFATAAVYDPTNQGKGTEVLKFDVAENGLRFLFAPTPVHEDGMPAYGNSFVTEGYIYPHGTLSGTNGVLENGQPEFPDKVIGKWTCRGWFVGDGGHTTSGPMVITTQLYDFSKNSGFGDVTVTSDGYELADINVAIERAITGGTGPYSNARGEGKQVLLGYTHNMGVNLRQELAIKKN